jgi:hypothetical protein
MVLSAVALEILRGYGDGDENMHFNFKVKMIHKKDAKTSQNRCPRGIAAHHLPRD